MNFELVDKIARAVLYEGYMLYPYRPSAVKNRQRWNFGVLYPRAYSALQSGSDASSMRTECLIEARSGAKLQVKVQFLQMIARSIGRLPSPISELPADGLPEFQLVERLEVEGRIFQPWQEAIEREISLPLCDLSELAGQSFLQPFSFAAENRVEAIRDAGGEIVGIIIRRQESLSGEIVLSAVSAGTDMFKTVVEIRNTIPWRDSKAGDREQALLSSLVSTHTVLGLQEGSFVSLLDPPEAFRELAATCANSGTWPVLVGENGGRDTMLSSPIILYDYPQIAPESAGDLFDGTEIDEILSLRIMTLTDEEKREVRQSDDRARQILERTETMPAEQLMKLHGILRGLRPVKEVVD